ncbi:hypothetical protein Droror1_Dr00025649, partial [Drosera rotundifolia]
MTCSHCLDDLGVVVNLKRLGAWGFTGGVAKLEPFKLELLAAARWTAWLCWNLSSESGDFPAACSAFLPAAHQSPPPLLLSPSSDSPLSLLFSFAVTKLSEISPPILLLIRSSFWFVRLGTFVLRNLLLL